MVALLHAISSLIMKKSLLPLCSVLALSITFTSCKKDKDDPQPSKSKTELLTNKYWRTTAATIDPAIDLFGTGTPTTNLYAQYQDCTKDDLVRFESGGVYKEDEGATKCSATDPQVTTGTWTFNSSETAITTTISGSTSTVNITELTENTLKGTITENFGGPVNYTITVNLVKQ